MTIYIVQHVYGGIPDEPELYGDLAAAQAAYSGYLADIDPQYHEDFDPHWVETIGPDDDFAMAFDEDDEVRFWRQEQVALLVVA